MKLLDRVYDRSRCWQMSVQERIAVITLINALPQRNIAIEVGCYTGGFLRHLLEHFATIHSIDLLHDKVNKDAFPSVTWNTGPSSIQLPLILEDLQKKGTPPTFVLIDGDHGYAAVRTDILSCLQIKPTSDTIILVHDSWYKESRRAIQSIPYELNKHVALIDLDFCTGSYTGDNWVGGFCLIYMTPETHPTPTIQQSEILAYQRATRHGN